MFGMPLAKQGSTWSETDFGNVDEHSICLPNNIFAGYNQDINTPGKLRKDLSFKYKGFAAAASGQKPQEISPTKLLL